MKTLIKNVQSLQQFKNLPIQKKPYPKGYGSGIHYITQAKCVNAGLMYLLSPII